MRAILLRIIIYGGLVLAILAGAALLAIDGLVETDKAKPRLERAFSNFLRRPLTIGTLGWRWMPVPSLIGYDVHLRDLDGESMVHAPEAVLRISPGALFRRRISFDDLLFIRPMITLRREASGALEVSRMVRDIKRHLGEKTDADPLFSVSFHAIVVKSGVVRLIDERIGKTPFRTIFHADGEGEIVGRSPGKRFPFHLETAVVHPETTGDLTIAGALAGRSRLSFESNAFPIAAFADVVPAFADWEGSLRFKGDFQNTIDGPAFHLVGETREVGPIVDAPVPNLSLQFRLQHPGASVATLTAEGPDESAATLSIDWPSLSTPSVSVAMTSPRLRAADVARWVERMKPVFPTKTRFPTQPNRAVAPWRVAFSADVESASFRAMTVENVRVTGTRFSTGTIRIDQITAAGMGGGIEGDALLHRPPGQSGALLPSRWSLRWQMGNVQAGPVAASFLGREDFSGTAHSSGTLSGDFARAGWRHVDGQLTLRVADGHVWGVPGFVKAFSQLNMDSLLEEINGDDQKRGFPFDVAVATVIIREGRVRFSEPGVFENETLRVIALGSANLPKNRIEATLAFEFLTVVDELIGIVPGLKTVMMGEKKSLIPVWVSVRGSLADPRVSVLPAKSIADTLWNTVSGVLKTPWKALKSVLE